MSIIKERLNLALSTIQKNESGYSSSCKYVDLINNIHINYGLKPEIGEIRHYLSLINQNFSNIQYIILRLEWQMEQYKRKELGDSLWMNFSACDINQFHVEIRSIFDYISKAIRLISDYPDQVPKRSFNYLKNNWLTDIENEKKIGKDLAEIVLSCEWFDEVKEVRETLLHLGGFTLVFLVPDRITFQVNKGWTNKISIPEIMYNKNVVDFELYAGLYIGYLVAYLEELSEIFDKRLNLKKIGGDSWRYHPGLEVMQSWIEKVNAI